MKGLLIKDMRLLINQGKTLFLMLIVISLILSVMGAESPSFVVSYITVIFSFFTASTISYDEYDNCYLFLMTLPVTRKGYVNEKFLFGFLSTVAAWAVGMAAGTILLLRESKEIDGLNWVGECAMYILVAWIFLCVMLPVRLKFEAEKAKYVNMILLVACILLVFAGSQLISYLPKTVIQSGVWFLTELGNGGFLLLSAMITAAAVIASYVSARHIMEKKQF